jgi:hypothetical protein
VLYVDAATGVSKWVFANAPQAADAQQQLVFPLPQIDAAAGAGDGGAQVEGVITKTMRGVAKVVRWVTDPLVGKAAQAIAKAWEDKRRPYGLQQVAADGSLADPVWSKFDGEPVLLLVHGTFSTPTQGFEGWLGDDSFKTVHTLYGGRVLALAHPTLHDSPDDNIKWFLEQLPNDRSWVFDTVSHSRGGLVVRSLAARAAASDKLQVQHMLMLASPNFGTPLADANHWITFLDAHTNLLTVAPDGVATIVAEGVLVLAKIIGGGALGRLPGLAAMDANGDYLAGLATRKIASAGGMFAVAADYAPNHPEVLRQLISSAADAAVNSFFEQANDLVVPTLGCSQGATAAIGFPIDGARVMPLKGGTTHHLNMFANADIRRQLGTWLQNAPALVSA